MDGGIPLATYRLQFTSRFTFDGAAAIVPYLKKLGVTHIYASPFMKARQGSTHGYDIVDHNVLNPELGGEDGFNRLSAALASHEIGLILDFVPNHMGVHHADNAWWLDVLEWGPKSAFADTFDIDWDILPFRSKPGLLLPILGSPYGVPLTRGEIELKYDPREGSFSAWYFEHRLPIVPDRYSDILKTIAGQIPPNSTRDDLLSVAMRYGSRKSRERDRASALKRDIAAVAGGAVAIRQGLEAYRAGPDRPAQTEALHRLLERQHYRLAHWKLATSDINYRRFFDVNSLAGIRVEDHDTFDHVHALVRRLIAENKIQGLRLDHIDGLYDPAQYCRRLRRLVHEAQGAHRRPFYLLIEKILEDDEAPPKFAGIEGTTGYECLNAISRVLADENGLETLDEVWRQASDIAPAFDPILRAAKRRVIETLLASEFTVLTRLLARIAAGHYSTRDYSADSLRQAFELFVLHFPVYRTYITPAGPTEGERKLIAETIAKARQEWFAADDGIFDFLQDALTLDLLAPGRSGHSRRRVRRFALKVQQFTGPTMAKSLEDTAFYRYHRLLAFNEVGGNPAAPALDVDGFYRKMLQRAGRQPHGLSTTATHDTKRGEDARTRILALTELSAEWASMVGRWKTWNAGLVSTSNGTRSPSVADEYMLYQALIGALPLDDIEPAFVARMKAYAEKACREAKLQTSWLNPDSVYEDGVRKFLTGILNEHRSPEFLQSLKSFARRTSLIGALNSLTQITLKATIPGVPDFYQGTELWDFSLVDPDNRRPVDFAARQAILDADATDMAALAESWKDGRIKLLWTHRLLDMRKRHAKVFTNGDFRPLAVEGAHRRHVIAFARAYRSEAIVVAALRHFAPFTDAGMMWPAFDRLDARVDLGNLAITHPAARERKLDLKRLFDRLPAALLPARISTEFAIARSRRLEQRFQKQNKRDTVQVKNHKTAN
ncbi:MAG: maltooligosyl trehalose synthase [Nitrobacter sp.]|uniref:malto-oligosyltrehalose synthase n=1 Tax=Nitrobacter sp. TaxID=29420 RepID=UPI00387DDFED